MASLHEQLMAESGAPALMDVFTDRNANEVKQSVRIVLEGSGEHADWPASVGALSVQLVEINERLVSKETCELIGATAELPTGVSTLPETAQVTVPRYGETPFHVLPNLCSFGGPLTKLTLVRNPAKQLNPLTARNDA